MHIVPSFSTIFIQPFRWWIGSDSEMSNKYGFAKNWIDVCVQNIGNLKRAVGFEYPSTITINILIE